MEELNKDKFFLKKIEENKKCLEKQIKLDNSYWKITTDIWTLLKETYPPMFNTIITRRKSTTILEEREFLDADGQTNYAIIKIRSRLNAWANDSNLRKIRESVVNSFPYILQDPRSVGVELVWKGDKNV